MSRPYASALMLLIPLLVGDDALAIGLRLLRLRDAALLDRKGRSAADRLAEALAKASGG